MKKYLNRAEFKGKIIVLIYIFIISKTNSIYFKKNLQF